MAEEQELNWRKVTREQQNKAIKTQKIKKSNQKGKIQTIKCKRTTKQWPKGKNKPFKFLDSQVKMIEALQHFESWRLLFCQSADVQVCCHVKFTSPSPPRGLPVQNPGRRRDRNYERGRKWQRFQDISSLRLEGVSAPSTEGGMKRWVRTWGRSNFLFNLLYFIYFLFSFR